jgi:hypothetical protein
LSRGEEKKMAKLWKKSSSGEYRLKTPQEMEEENPQHPTRTRKMCFDIESLDDIPGLLSRLKKV